MFQLFYILIAFILISWVALKITLYNYIVIRFLLIHLYQNLFNFTIRQLTVVLFLLLQDLFIICSSLKSNEDYEIIAKELISLFIYCVSLNKQAVW